jgi:hypothetical protein
MENNSQSLTTHRYGWAKEFWAVTIIIWGLFVSIAFVRGGLGLSWDTLNHHVYLGWVASHARFDEDFFAAATQSYQFPYLYWPVYKMTQMGITGWSAGVLWASVHVLVAPPLWQIAKTLIPDGNINGAIFRFTAVLLGVGNILVLRAVETTGNDVLASTPFILAMALALSGVTDASTGLPETGLFRRAILVGLLGGAAVAFKLSNGVLAFVLPIIFMFYPINWVYRTGLFCLCAIGICVGFAALYGWWGWQLWLRFGNPVFPFYDGVFEQVRILIGWRALGVA